MRCCSQQVQSKLDDETEWSNNIARIAGFANETAVGFEAQYNETVWFPMARDAISRYMEVRRSAVLSSSP